METGSCYCPCERAARNRMQSGLRELAGESFTSTGPSAGNDLTAAFRRHAGSKTVRALTL